MAVLDVTTYSTRRYQHVDWGSERWVGFDPRPGDIYVCTCYKSGTTWTQMIVALLVFQSSTFPAPLNELSPWVDLWTDTKEVMHAQLGAQKHRRILKTHTPVDGLKWHSDAKYLYVARDPREVFESMLIHQANTDIETERALAAVLGNAQTVSDLLAESDEERVSQWLNRGFFNGKEMDIPTGRRFIMGNLFGVTGMKKNSFPALCGYEKGPWKRNG